ncbi:ABC transporter substrate-binding protein [Vreelandella boliviensis]|uniref:Iron(3+)-hydroxamate-binding protein fhuD n=1 Tax=Vreelandella boliviensis LC1 TaxID=1072583 RepID=A0A265E386_9GAMM|nr:ABC transporter substrate-binding protein [Halomonas boliviensis]EHJ93411.1 Iron(3+)-hydroxamate-binding protein fhuD [Halomonas boliviensis LC1]OZT76054.1 iron(3+)-hydroxamate-binding protein fhuD [Halomonas boliviensis LC1]
MVEKIIFIFVFYFFSEFALSYEKPSVVASDWAVAETLDMLGVTPIAIAQLRNYQAWTGNEVIIGDAIEVGLKPMPNLELIADYNPTLIVGGNPILMQHISSLAPTMNISLYPLENDPWQSTIDFTFEIAEQLNLHTEALNATTQANRKIAIMRGKVDENETPIIIAQFRDDRHAWVYGKNSLLQGVIDQLGLTNAWDQPTSDIGLSVVTIDVLARSEGHLVIIESPAYQERIGERLESSAIWQILISQREEKISYLPANYWPIGALPSALRFAESLVEALETPAEPQPTASSQR